MFPARFSTLFGRTVRELGAKIFDVQGPSNAGFVGPVHFVDLQQRLSCANAGPRKLKVHSRYNNLIRAIALQDQQSHQKARLRNLIDGFSIQQCGRAWKLASLVRLLMYGRFYSVAKLVTAKAAFLFKSHLPYM